MAAIGFTGAQSFAVTTKPFNTRRHGHSWYQEGATASGAVASGSVGAGK
jgi:cytochrome c oxidase subunit 2